MDTQENLLKVAGVDFAIKQIDVNGFNINYVVGGKGTPLLLIHGGNIGWGQWYPNLKALSSKFRVYAIDLPGGGHSQKINFDNFDLEQDLVVTVEKFCEELNLRKLSIVGALEGGWIGLRLALREKLDINKIVLVDSVGLTNYIGIVGHIFGIHPLMKFISKTILKPVRSNKNVEKYLRSVLYKKKFRLPRQYIDYFYETMQHTHNLVFVSYLFSPMRLRPELFIKDSLGKVKKEVLIIWGERDVLLPLEKSAPAFKLFRKSRVEIFENTGHMPSLEKSKRFDDLLLEFL